MTQMPSSQLTGIYIGDAKKLQRDLHYARSAIEMAEQLARALYETAPGTNGYRPLHESITWERLPGKDWWRERAREITSKMREYEQ